MPVTDQDLANFFLNEAHHQYEGTVPGARGRYMETAATLAIGFYLKAILEKLNEPEIL